jgi:hypothetical protein
MHRTTLIRPAVLRAVWSLFGIVLLSSAQAQRTRPTKDVFDTLYVYDFSKIVTGRVYSSTKNNRMVLGGRQAAKDLDYRPNNRINLGVGASYRALTLNLGFPVPFLNTDDEVRGKTRYLDAQANIYTKRTATNLFLQVFGGYYLNSHSHAEVNWPVQYERPYRPDLTQFNLGFSTVRILNSDRFSYRASFNQDAWQRRSQGSWLIGGYGTYFAVRADSSLVPTALRDQFNPDVSLRRGGFVDFGPMGGYVYTLVVREHFFLTLSGVVGAGLNMQQLTYPVAEGEARRFDVGPGWHAQLRSGAGYNSRTYYVGIGYNQERIGYLLQDQQRFTWTVSNLRFNVVKRFNTKIGFMDRGIRWAKKKAPEQLEDILPK